MRQDSLTKRARGLNMNAVKRENALSIEEVFSCHTLLAFRSEHLS
jgi:hypothetical protein